MNRKLVIGRSSKASPLPYRIFDKPGQHYYSIGRTGSGKTTFLVDVNLKRIWRGDGVGVINADDQIFRDELLPHIPRDRVDDVVYFNPRDIQRPVCFNPFHLAAHEDVDVKVDNNLVIIQRAVGDFSPRMTMITRHMLYALVQREGSTLLDVPRLLSRTDDGMRREVLRDPNQHEMTKEFFSVTYDELPRDAALPIINRLDGFTRPLPINRMLCNPNSSFNFRQAMDQGKIVFLNCSEGALGELNSGMLGQIYMSAVQQAAFSRENVPEDRRRPFYLTIDEFWQFMNAASSANTLASILAKARKFKMGMLLANQNTSQLPNDLLESILGNTHGLICFKIADSDAKRLSNELILFDAEQRKMIINRLKILPIGQAMVKFMGPHKFLTMPLPKQPQHQPTQAVMDASRARYGVPVVEPTRPPQGHQRRPLQFDDNEPQL